ncbi:MAG TPA: MBL fold metallo-hydrolase [Deltaproteobacteria bacterium]|nr:MBL fold metallo-hydrolase [Deltaproteobacteria bacterium]HQI80147.1 MBL fold metallo-hydrolase [Deltaproteobacteria bacterium]
MVIDRPGPVTDRITLLGRQESCVYLVGGPEEYSLLGGGMTYVVPDILAQLADFSIDESKITRLIILHSHFDHVGIVPFFRKRLPHVRVCASRRGRDQLLRPEVVAVIVDFNRVLLAREGMEGREAELGLPFGSIVVDEVLTDGQTLQAGDLDLEVMEVPGHSSCSIAVYCPQEKALFASDAGGIPFGDKVFAAANSNYDQYQASLQRMSRLDVDVHCAEHYGALTGDDARGFMPRSMESARLTRIVIEDAYRRTRDVARTVEEVTNLLASESQGYFLPREVMEMVVGQMTRYLAKTLNL